MENEKLILNILVTFKKETGNEVVIIKDVGDILEGEEIIYTKFGFLLIPNSQLFIKSILDVEFNKLIN